MQNFGHLRKDNVVGIKFRIKLYSVYRYMICGLLICLSTNSLLAQEEEVFKKHRSIRYFLGAQLLTINSESSSNINYSGLSIPLAAAYKIQTDKRKQLAIFEYTSHRLTNSFNLGVLKGSTLSLEYHHGINLSKPSMTSVNVYLGGYLKVKGQFRKVENNQFITNTKEGYGSIGPVVSIMKYFGEDHLLDFTLRTPFFSIIKDRQFDYSKEGRWAHPLAVIDYNFNATYTMRPKNDTSFMLSYNFNYFRKDRNQFSAEEASHTISVGFFIQI